MKKILLITSCLFIAMLALVGCGNKEKEEKLKENLSVVKVNGRELALPCTLTEMEDVGVFIARKSAKQEIVNSENQDFALIEMTSNSFEEDEILKVMISTGEDHKKKEENCFITRIINESVDSEKFVVGDKIGFGSTIKDAKKIFGKKNFELITENDDEKKGLSQLQYFEDGKGRVMYFQDDKCVYIEVWGDIPKENVDVVD